jgi:hypothetical protein
MKKARINLTLQFVVDIDEAAIPDGSADYEQERNERLRRLLQALLSDPDRRRTYLRYCVASRIELFRWQDWYDLVMGDEAGQAREVLLPSIATLSQSDQEFFQDVEKHDVFYENIEILLDCFSTELERMGISIVEDER